MILIDIQETLLDDLGVEKHNVIARQLLPLNLKLIKKMTDKEFDASKRCYVRHLLKLEV